MTVLGRLHGRHVFARRVRVLATRLAEVLPERATILDVGCGDGSIASRLLLDRPDLEVSGIDVLVREGTKIPVTPFDGITIPFADDSLDVVMFVDVLHHTDDPESLLAEAKRVARHAIVLKDHTRNGLLAGPTLRFMDWVGNKPHGVRLPYNYLAEAEWRKIFESLGLEIRAWSGDIGLYPWPASMLFDRGLHFVASLEP